MMLFQCCWLLFCVQLSSSRPQPSKPYLKEVNESYHRLLAEKPNILLVPYEDETGSGSGISDQKETCTHSTLQRAIEVLQNIALNCVDGIAFQSCCEPKFVLHQRLSSTLYPLQTPSKLARYAYCDMENNGGGWMVILRRGSGYRKGKFREGMFDKLYRAYTRGFGKLNRDFWMGLQTVMEYIVQNGGVELLVEARLAGSSVTQFAHYHNFALGPSSTNYILNVSGYDEGSTLEDSLSYSNGYPFHHFEMEWFLLNPSPCVLAYNGPWWYNHSTTHSCTKVALFRWSFSGFDHLPREPFRKDPYREIGNNRPLPGGPLWEIKGSLEPMDYIQMKIRPKTWECGADPYSEYQLKRAYLHPLHT